MISSVVSTAQAIMVQRQPMRTLVELSSCSLRCVILSYDEENGESLFEPAASIDRHWILRDQLFRKLQVDRCLRGERPFLMRSISGESRTFLSVFLREIGISSTLLACRR